MASKKVHVAALVPANNSNLLRQLNWALDEFLPMKVSPERRDRKHQLALLIEPGSPHKFKKNRSNWIRNWTAEMTDESRLKFVEQLASIFSLGRFRRQPWLAHWDRLRPHLTALPNRLEIVAELTQFHSDLLVAMEQVGMSSISPQPAHVGSFTKTFGRENGGVRLSLPLMKEEVKGLSNLFYGRRVSSFVGRKEDMAALEGFVRSGDPFSWTLVLGQGGSGKSRLALELCFRMDGAGWQSGFLNYNATPEEFWHWVPAKPTLIVIDYVLERAELVAEIIRVLHSRALYLTQKVRILCLERELDERLEGKLYGVGGAERRETLGSQYAAPREIAGMGDDELWEIVRERCATENVEVPSQNEVVEALARLDARRRPLFALLLAEAMVDGASSGFDSQIELLRHSLRRERGKWWKPLGVSPDEEQLLAVATMCGGIERDAQVPRIADVLGRFTPSAYQTASGRPALDRLHPLEPDIIGEFFVLEYLGSQGVSADVLAASVNSAWLVSPEYMFSFMSRCSLDFGGHPSMPILARAPTDGETVRHWADTVVNVVLGMSVAGRVSEAIQIYNSLSLHTWSLKMDEMFVALAHTLLNVVVGSTAVGDLRSAHQLLEDSKRIVAANPRNPEIQRTHAKVFFNLASAYAERGQLERGSAVYRELAAYGAMVQSREVYVRQASTAYNLACASEGAVEPSATWGFYRSLEKFKNEWNADPRIAEDVAGLMQMLVHKLLSVDRKDEAWRAFAALTRHARANPTNCGVVRFHIAAATGIVVEIGANDLTRAQAAFARCIDLASRHPVDNEIQDYLARVTAGLIHCMAEAMDSGYASDALVALNPLQRSLRQSANILSSVEGDSARLLAESAARLIVAMSSHRRRLDDAQSFYVLIFENIGRRDVMEELRLGAASALVIAAFECGCFDILGFAMLEIGSITPGSKWAEKWAYFNAIAKECARRAEENPDDRDIAWIHDFGLASIHRSKPHS